MFYSDVLRFFSFARFMLFAFVFGVYTYIIVICSSVNCTVSISNNQNEPRLLHDYLFLFTHVRLNNYVTLKAYNGAIHGGIHSLWTRFRFLWTTKVAQKKSANHNRTYISILYGYVNKIHFKYYIFTVMSYKYAVIKP